MEGTIVSTFLVVFREALEASLIVGIILTILARLQQKRYFPHVLFSVATAIGVSVVAGIWLKGLTESAQEGMEKIIEGVISLAACSVLTYMIFWMDSQARRIRPEIETKLETAVTRAEYVTIITLPFLAVFREGAETVLFLSAVAMQNSGVVSFWGALSGLVLAVAIVVFMFVGGKRIPLRPLFQGSGIFLLLIAAGLLAYGIHELEEVGWVSPLYAPIWNINHILNEKEGIGSFLKAIFGYNGNPSLMEVMAYSFYVMAISWALFRRRPQAA